MYNTIMQCQGSTIKKAGLYEWSSAVFLPAKAEAQTSNTFGDISVSGSSVNSNPISAVSYSESDLLPTPILVMLLMFFVFMFVLSGVYVYHWVTFNLGDKFIKNAVFVYFVGLVLLTLPLVAFII